MSITIGKITYAIETRLRQDSAAFLDACRRWDTEPIEVHQVAKDLLPECLQEFREQHVTISYDIFFYRLGAYAAQEEFYESLSWYLLTYEQKLQPQDLSDGLELFKQYGRGLKEAKEITMWLDSFHFKGISRPSGSLLNSGLCDMNLQDPVDTVEKGNDEQASGAASAADSPASSQRAISQSTASKFGPAKDHAAEFVDVKDDMSSYELSASRQSRTKAIERSPYPSRARGQKRSYNYENTSSDASLPNSESPVIRQAKRSKGTSAVLDQNSSITGQAVKADAAAAGGSLNASGIHDVKHKTFGQAPHLSSIGASSNRISPELASGILSGAEAQAAKPAAKVTNSHEAQQSKITLIDNHFSFEGASTTILWVSMDHKPGMGPVPIPIDGIHSMEDLFERLLSENFLARYLDSEVDAMTVTFPSLGNRTQILRRWEQEDWKQFCNGVQESWSAHDPSRQHAVGLYTHVVEQAM